MKKRISLFSFVLLIFISTQSFAQIRFGARAGFNLSNMKVSKDWLGPETKKINPAFHIGGIVEYGINKFLGLESGLLISGKGIKSEYEYSYGSFTITNTTRISPLYLEVPFDAVGKLDLGAVKVLFFTGPYIGIGIGGKYKSKYSASGLPSGTTLPSLGFDDKSVDIKFGKKDNSDMKRTDFGLNIGTGIEIKGFLLRAQFDIGLSNLDPEGSSLYDMKNRVFGISFGYMFGGK
jgi:hypothetical protein